MFIRRRRRDHKAELEEAQEKLADATRQLAQSRAEGDRAAAIARESQALLQRNSIARIIHDSIVRPES